MQNRLERIKKTIHQKRVGISNWLFEVVFNYKLKRKLKNDLIPNDYKIFKHKEEIEKWAEPYYDYSNDLRRQVEVLHPPKEKKQLLEVLSYYAGNQHRSINDYHRGKLVFASDEYIEGRSDILSREIDKFRTKENLVVVRRIENEYAPNTKKSNEIFQDLGYLSTSLNLNYRLDVQSVSKPLERETILVIKVPKGTSAFYLSAIRDRNEYELLIQRGRHFRVESRLNILGNKIMFIELMNM